MSVPPSPHVPPLFGADLPAVGGALGPEPEDFRVDEIPAYAARGAGEHWYVRVEKRRLTTIDVVRRLARASGTPERDIGYAGMKDKHAVTTQWLSLPGRAQNPGELDLGPDARVLEVNRHDNKLRTGHLAGNRFRVVLTGVAPGAVERAEAIVSRLRRRGVPNYFGAQRFGRGGESLAQALAWLSRGGRGRDRFEQKLYPSVVQAEIFNRYVTARLELGSDRLIAGEVVRLDGAGAMFRVEELEREQPRYDAGDLHLTGPMPGPKLRPAAGEALALEERVIASLGLGAAELETLGRAAPGTRRDLFMPLGELRVEPVAETSLRLCFDLPAGGYATEVIRQLTHAPYFAARGEAAAPPAEAEPE